MDFFKYSRYFYCAVVVVRIIFFFYQNKNGSKSSLFQDSLRLLGHGLVVVTLKTREISVSVFHATSVVLSHVKCRHIP